MKMNKVAHNIIANDYSMGKNESKITLKISTTAKSNASISCE
jgi:hypothetical protein